MLPSVWVKPLLCNNFVVWFRLTHLDLRPLQLQILHMVQPRSRIHVLNTRAETGKSKLLEICHV